MIDNITDVIYNKCDYFLVVDILPNLDVLRCFGTSQYTRVKMSQFNNIKQLRKYYIENYELKLRIKFEILIVLIVFTNLNVQQCVCEYSKEPSQMKRNKLDL